MPGPSWRPFLGAFGVFALFLGLVFGGWLLAVGVIALIATLVGWLTDAVLDYRRIVEGGRTGHIDNGPPPATPPAAAHRPDRADRRCGGPPVGRLHRPVRLRAPVGRARPRPRAASLPRRGRRRPDLRRRASRRPTTADVTIQAKGIAFVETSFTAPAGKPFTIAFANEDPGVPHNVELKDSTGAVAYKGEVFNGVETRVYDVPALAAGTYPYVCTVHTNMTGTATLQ